MVPASGVGLSAISPDGFKIATGAGDIIVRVFETFTGVMIKELRGHEHSVNCVCFSPNGDSLASASSDECMKLWDISDGSSIGSTLVHKSAVHAVCYN